MIFLNIIVEGSSEETFVKGVLKDHFVQNGVYVTARKILTGWDKSANRPAKGGMLKYSKFRNDVFRWIESDRGRADTYYTSMVDLYAFPVDNNSPYNARIRGIHDPFLRVEALEDAIASDIGHPTFIPYVQLHEFEALVLTDPERLLVLYPGKEKAIARLKNEIAGKHPEEINENSRTAPSKRIIKHIPEYDGQKAQAGPLVVEDIGLNKLREHCAHFNQWITKLEGLTISD
ncbi:protein of unknown function [Porphyromonadaceae bacterium KHP3R9]|nr:protein of unknown function [Porphyromonadaceae bacterium KHP3R9]